MGFRHFQGGLRNLFGGGVENFFLGGRVEKFSRGLKNFRGEVENFFWGGEKFQGGEKFSGGGVEKFLGGVGIFSVGRG